MIKVGITGNIASGKSEIEKILIQKGYKVIDADDIAHELLVLHEADIIKAFSGYNITVNGKISRKLLGDIVFINKVMKDKLEAILHPLIFEKVNAFFDEHKNEDIVFVSAALLYESGMDKLVDKVLFIYCDDRIRLEHLIARNNLTREEALIRMHSQVPQEEKVYKSFYVINNNETLQALYKKVDMFLSKVKEF